MNTNELHQLIEDLSDSLALEIVLNHLDEDMPKLKEQGARLKRARDLLPTLEENQYISHAIKNIYPNEAW